MATVMNGYDEYDSDQYEPDFGCVESPMETEEVEGNMKPSSSLQIMLSSIAQERNQEYQDQKLISADDGAFVLVCSRHNFWTDLFSKHFIESPDDSQKDDMLFYVRKDASKSEYNIPQTEIEVFRKSSKTLPNADDAQIDWEETVYLNLILQHFEYQVTCAVCCRTGEKELQILKKFTQKVYASPSKRQMDGKGTGEEITYPNIFFTVDNFEEAFSDIIVRDSEIVCVELVAKDRQGTLQGVIFLGSIKYESLKKVYDSRASLTHRMAQRMSLGWFRGQKRVEFVRMRGPQGKGHAEMAVSRVKGSGPETPEQTPNTENFPVEDFEQEDPYSQRRMSDPNTSWNYFVRGSFKKSGIRKSRSETENVDSMSNGCSEVEAGTIEDEFDDTLAHYNGFFGKSFGQAWHWFKERRRANSVALHGFLTYITLPWHRIIAGSHYWLARLRLILYGYRGYGCRGRYCHLVVKANSRASRQNSVRTTEVERSLNFGCNVRENPAAFVSTLEDLEEDVLEVRQEPVLTFT